jgi:hypothetical protein
VQDDDTAAPAFEHAERRKLVVTASGAGAGAVGAGRWAAGLGVAGAVRGATTGTVPWRCSHGATRVGSRGTCRLKVGHSSRSSGVLGGV